MDETLFQLVDIDWQTGTDEMGIWQLLIISLFIYAFLTEYSYQPFKFSEL